MTREAEIAWAAGLFEGEGSIYTHPDKADILISLSMTDRDVVERFAAIVDADVRVRVRPVAKTQAHYKTLWIFAAQGPKAETIVRLLLPYLGQRRTARATEILAKRDAWKAHAMRERDCEYCGESFRPTHAHGFAARQRFCSRVCSRRYYDMAYRRHGGAVPKGEASRCRNGHQYTEGNTRIDENGYRNCRACGREAKRLQRELVA